MLVVLRIDSACTRKVRERGICTISGRAGEHCRPISVSIRVLRITLPFRNCKPREDLELSSAQQDYRPDIDGLRAIAVVLVIAFHMGVPGITGGFVGVDVFFVISGYLIGAIIYRGAREGTFTFAGFYARRARRILPALFFVLLCSCIFALLLLTPKELIRFVRDSLSAILALSNINFLLEMNYFDGASRLNPLLMTWSLGVEEQFYLLFPVLVLILCRFCPRYVFQILLALCLASLAISITYTPIYPAASFYLLPTRAWELGVGVLLAIHEISRSKPVLEGQPVLANLCGVAGLFCIVFAATQFDANTHFPGTAAVLPVAGSAFILSARQSRINEWLLAAQPMRFLGLISYSWYLWHWPLLSFARIASDQELTFPVAAAVIAASLAAAIFSWRFIERWSRRSRLPAEQTLLRYSALTAGMLALTMGLLVHHGWQQRFPSALSSLERSRTEFTENRCLVDYGVVEPNLGPSCVSQGTQQQVVALLGDSHAAALAGAIHASADASGYGFIQFAKGSCPPLLGVTRRMSDHPLHAQECASFNENALKILLDQPSVRTVVLAAFWSAPFVADNSSRLVRTDQLNAIVSPEESRQNFESGLRALVRRLSTAHKQVVLIQDAPYFNFNPLRHAEARWMPARHTLERLIAQNSDIDELSTSRSNVIDDQHTAFKIIDSVAAGLPDVTVLDMQQRLCDLRRCRFADDSRVYYIDAHHLSLQGARYALEQLKLSR
jgi:peptidoglycan/LPS O-acetylase OafA/YrhL